MTDVSLQVFAPHVTDVSLQVSVTNVNVTEVSLQVPALQATDESHRNRGMRGARRRLRVRMLTSVPWRIYPCMHTGNTHTGTAECGSGTRARSSTAASSDTSLWTWRGRPSGDRWIDR